MSSGQWVHSGDGVRWFFDAGAESLDFAYTGDGGRAVPRWEHLHTAPDLGGWLAARFPRVEAGSATDRDLADALELRAAISRLATARADRVALDADDIDTINLFAATPDVPPALDGGRRQAGTHEIRVAQALASLARDAVTVLADAESPRIRRCDAEDCHMVFRDESRTLNRRWCSMQRCGNRAKVRAHRARAAARTDG